MIEPTRMTLQLDIVNKINTACKYILSLPNYKNIERPARPIQILTLVDPCGYLPIHYAIAAQNEFLFNLLVEIFRTLTSPLYYLNAPDRVGNTPLHWAVMRTNYQAAVILIQHGADVSRMNNDGRTPLHIVVSQSSKSDTQTNLSAHRRMTKFLITVGAKVDSCDLNNVTPLHIAAEMGDVITVETLLIDGGAFVNIIDEVGETPLFYALRGRNVDVVKKLVENKANLFARNEEGETPLEFCFSIKDVGMIDLLNQFISEISPCFLFSGSSGMNISGINFSSMSISDSNNCLTISSNEHSSMDIDLSKSQEYLNHKQNPGGIVSD